MDKLKAFIDENRAAFEEEMLPPGHMERFERKLPRKTIAWRNWRMIAASAAAIALLLGLGTLYHTAQRAGEKPAPTETSASISDEFKDLCLYYQMRVNDLVARMEALSRSESAPGLQGLLSESKRVVSDNLFFERTILPTLPTTGKGLHAITLHYENSLEGLAFMLRKMEQISGVEERNE